MPDHAEDEAKYYDDPEWADIEPIQQADQGPNPLAAIAYTDEYAEAMAYLRAVMARDEKSERVLRLTKDVIEMNPAHYTVWLYRAQVLFATHADLHKELEWLNETASQYQKNYQIWHHRQLIVSRLCPDPASSAATRGPPFPGAGIDVDSLVAKEISFVASMFDKDAKNYHVWSYRQWLVRHFGLWDKGELEFTEASIEKDVRNNSAWNHRWYVVNGKEGSEGVKEEKVREREIAFTKRQICLAPQNQSPWNYLRGILRKANLRFSTIQDFCVEFADLSKPEGDDVFSSHALDLLTDIYAMDEGRNEQAKRCLLLLKDKYDPIRANYWQYRLEMLDKEMGSGIDSHLPEHETRNLSSAVSA
ncbi:CAAX geranylgeranyltransferase alpha subunit [Elasticomyces elasticus]|nr:CAAX geranylgeranyltransferase alpha subunit [Elasticomyces elasticus]